MVAGMDFALSITSLATPSWVLLPSGMIPIDPPLLFFFFFCVAKIVVLFLFFFLINQHAIPKIYFNIQSLFPPSCFQLHSSIWVTGRFSLDSRYHLLK